MRNLRKFAAACLSLLLIAAVAKGQAHTSGVGAEVPAEKPAKDMTAKENATRMAAWRTQIRKILYVPETLPALEAKTVVDFFTDGGCAGRPGDLSDAGWDAGSGDCVPA